MPRKKKIRPKPKRRQGRSFAELMPEESLDVPEFDMMFKPDLPPAATSAEPGSSEKFEILRQRFEQGYELWHPEDRVIDYVVRFSDQDSW